MSDEKKIEEAGEDELDQIIRDMAEEEEEDGNAPAPTPVATAPTQTAAVAPLSLAKTGATQKQAEQSLTMELSGVVNLKLCFASGDRSIEVHCTEEALVCRMADGTEFRIPTGITKKRNAA